MSVQALARRWSARLLAPRIDMPLMLALLALMAVGLAVLYSASYGNTSLVQAQALRFGVGLMVLWLISRVPPLQMRLWTPWLFGITLFLLLLVPLFGSGRSARSWLNLGVVYLQPAELLKLTVPMAVASFLCIRPLPPGWTSLFGCVLLIGLPTALIAIQPDLGTALLVGASGGFAVLLAGLAWWRLGLLMLAGVAAAPLGWMFLREYQRDRLRTFMNPEADPLGTGWNIIQSKIAVGSGGLFGKGWGEGTQSRLDFLPEHTTDFILAVFAEEFGLVGILLLLGLYLFIIGRAMWIAGASRDTYARLLGGALALTFFVYVIVNGGMVTGLLPVVGVPMPLMSFGGTSAVSLLAAFGVLMSIHSHRRFMGD